MSILLTGLTKNFGAFRAVDELDLLVPTGTVCGFLGPNGSGKTTTVRMMAGLLRPDAGDVALMGHSVTRARRAAKASLGVLPEGGALFPNMTLHEHLLLEARVRGLREAEAVRRAEDLLRYAALWDRRTVYARDASVGMRKKLALALAVIHLPPVVLLDEPFEGLDPVGARKMHRLLTTLVQRRGTTVLLTSHLLELIADLVDQVVMIRAGRIVRRLDRRADAAYLAAAYLETFDTEGDQGPDFPWLS